MPIKRNDVRKAAEIKISANSSRSKTLAIKTFANLNKWQQWLDKNHAVSAGLWLRIQKKHSSRKSVTYAQALDAALCYGWIDGQKRPGDVDSWLQKFTPRRPKSGWSKKNTEHVKRLTKAGLMKPAGLAAVAHAKKEGRWKAAYDSQRGSQIPADFLKQLARNKKALSFFDSLNKANLYAIAYRLQTAKKPETREKRLKLIIGMMAKRLKFHP